MPERYKLTPRQIETVLANGPLGKWVVVEIDSAVILGSGPSTIRAIRNAKASHRDLDLDAVAFLYVPLDARKPARANGAGSRKSPAVS